MFILVCIMGAFPVLGIPILIIYLMGAKMKISAQSVCNWIALIAIIFLAICCPILCVASLILDLSTADTGVYLGILVAWVVTIAELVFLVNKVRKHSNLQKKK